jgi:hypothetical protein
MKPRNPPIGSSYSEDFLNSRNGVPQVSALMTQGISHIRKEIMASEVARGVYREGTGPSFADDGLTPNAVVASAVGFSKNAQVASGGGYGGGGLGGMGGTVKQIPEVYSPLWLTSNLNLPRDRATINAWCRAFYALNPFVQNAIQLHSTYPISKLSIKCPNPKIQKFFDDMIEELDLMNICVQIAQEFWLLGEAFIYAELDSHKGKWSRLMIYNPDYMIVKRTVIASEPLIMLRPDENLKRVVSSNRPADIEQRKQLNQHIVNSVKRGENIPLDNFSCTHLARKISPYEIRGTGLPVCIFRQLMLFDLMRESKYAQASNMINPLTLVKIGNDGPDGLHPTHADLEAWRQVFESATADRDFKIFTHPGVTVERIGWGQGIYDISGDITQLIKEIFIGLQTPPVVMDGTDITYNNGGVALDVLRQRYMQFRNMMSAFLRRKIFAPISRIQGFYDVVDGKKQLIVPDIDWNHMSLFDAGDYITNLVNLTASSGPSGPPPRASLHTLYRSLGLEWEDEQRKLRKEAIAAEILKKEQTALTALPLTELRSLDENEDISEPVAGPGQAAAAEQPVPGEVPPGGAPMPDLGGLPGLGGPPPPPPPAPEAAPAPPPPK